VHFKTCRKASSSDDCERITDKPEVIGLSTGLVPRNTLAFIEFDANSWMVGNAEGMFGLCCGSDQIQTKWQD